MVPDDLLHFLAPWVTARLVSPARTSTPPLSVCPFENAGRRSRIRLNSLANPSWLHLDFLPTTHKISGGAIARRRARSEMMIRIHSCHTATKREKARQ
jgi:hypothetical protein